MKAFETKVNTDKMISLEKFIEDINRIEGTPLISGSSIMVKLNGQLVKKKDFPNIIVQKGDNISIYPLIGGG